MQKSVFLSFTALLLSVSVSLAPSKSEQIVLKSLKNSTIGKPEKDLPPAEQARMLLRKIYVTGKVGSELASLDADVEKRIGQKCQITRDQLRMYLEKIHVSDWEIGGNIDLPLCCLRDTSNGQQFAKYFVIHDTSFPRYGKDFPSNMNDDSWEWNRLNRWVAPVTHIYVNRVGDSKTMTPFQEGMTATKLERFVLGDAATKGLYLHVELIQPRKYMKGYGRHNDADAPSLGFTDGQYKRLALLYTVAAVRKGEYLIPGFHACVDSGIKYAHDDPQNFELPKFFKALNDTWADMEKSTGNGNVKFGSGE